MTMKLSEVFSELSECADDRNEIFWETLADDIDDNRQLLINELFSEYERMNEW